MPKSAVLAVIVLGIAMIVVGSCGRDAGTAKAGANAGYAVLDAQDEPLRGDFNHDKGFIRLMFLVDPRCPHCLRGLADMGDDLLAKLAGSARVRVYVVHEPVIGGTDKDIPAAAELLHTSLARHYWNPTGDFGRQMSHVLGYRNGARWVYAWDTWLIYPADAVWSGKDPPQPVFLMHQLGGLESSSRFQRLDANVFAAKVNAMLGAPNEQSTAR